MIQREKELRPKVEEKHSPKEEHKDEVKQPDHHHEEKKE